MRESATSARVRTLAYSTVSDDDALLSTAPSVEQHWHGGSRGVIGGETALLYRADTWCTQGIPCQAPTVRERRAVTPAHQDVMTQSIPQSFMMEVPGWKFATSCRKFPS
jgi:hypothetical protein